jgi:hypothetical protein
VFVGAPGQYTPSGSYYYTCLSSDSAVPLLAPANPLAEIGNSTAKNMTLVLLAIEQQEEGASRKGCTVVGLAAGERTGNPISSLCINQLEPLQQNTTGGVRCEGAESKNQSGLVLVRSLMAASLSGLSWSVCGVWGMLPGFSLVPCGALPRTSAKAVTSQGLCPSHWAGLQHVTVDTLSAAFRVKSRNYPSRRQATEGVCSRPPCEYRVG